MLTLLDIIQGAKSRLSEGNNSPAGQLTTGTGGILITTEDTAAAYYNDGAADLARACYPLRDFGTVTAGASQSNFPWHTFALDSGANLWHAEQGGVSFAGAALAHASESNLRMYFTNMATAPAGTPLYWYHKGNDGISIYPKPLFGGLLSVDGYVTPKPLTNYATVITAATNANPIVISAANPHGMVTGQTIVVSGALVNTAANGTWVITVLSPTTFSIPATGNGVYTSGGVFAETLTDFDPDLYNLLQFYMAGKLAEKNLQRPDLAQRAGMWMSEFNAGKQQLLGRLWTDDPLTARAHFPKMAG